MAQSKLYKFIWAQNKLISKIDIRLVKVGDRNDEDKYRYIVNTKVIWFDKKFS